MPNCSSRTGPPSFPPLLLDAGAGAGCIDDDNFEWFLGMCKCRPSDIMEAIKAVSEKVDSDVMLLQETVAVSQSMLGNTMAPGGHQLIINTDKGYDTSIVVHIRWQERIIKQRSTPAATLIGIRPDSKPPGKDS